MKWRIVTRIEEYCDDDGCFQDLTLKSNGADNRLLVLKGGQVDNEIRDYAPAEQGGKKELAAAPGDQRPSKRWLASVQKHRQLRRLLL